MLRISVLGKKKRIVWDIGDIESAGNEGNGVVDVRSLAFMEKRHIEKVLKDTSWRRAEAARVLGINRTTLYNKIKEYGITQ